jgi:hypothetical protein
LHRGDVSRHLLVLGGELVNALAHGSEFGPCDAVGSGLHKRRCLRCQPAEYL